MKNDFLFEGGPYTRLLHRLGIGGKRSRDVVIRAGVGVIVCWLPLAVLSWLNGSFWTGDAATSFISNMDVQTRLLVTMPIFIIAEKMIGSSLTLTLGQFIRSGVVDRDDKTGSKRLSYSERRS